MAISERAIISKGFTVAVSDARVKRMLLEYSTRRVYYNGHAATLTKTEFQILSILVQNDRQIVSLEELSRCIWGLYTAGCDNALRVNVCHIRRKIGEPDVAHSCIRTVRNCGYRLVL